MRFIRALLIIAMLSMMAAPTMAGIGRITFNGTNSTNFNVSVSGVNHTPVLFSYTDSNHTVRINVTNASDTLYLQFWNLTAGRVYEWRGNNTVTSLNAYRANSSGAVNITLIQDGTAGAGQNISYSLKPAVNVGGYNFTWGIFGMGLTTRTATSNAIYTVYQNANDVPMLVSIPMNLSTSTIIYAESDSNNPPATRVYQSGDVSFTTNAGITPSFIVMPKHYYTVKVNTGTPTIINWWEYT